jgi:hypothetical protein
MTKTIALLIAALLTFAACGDDGAASSTTASGDETVSSDDPTTTAPPSSRTEPGPATIDSIEFLFLESYPVQVMAVVRGTMPTPCHDLAWEAGMPDASGRVTLEVSSLYDPAEVCAQVIAEFEENIPIGSFESGEYALVADGVEYPFTI